MKKKLKSIEDIHDLAVIAKRKKEKAITHDEMIKKLKIYRYERGYRRFPESLKEIKALEKLSIDFFKAERLEVIPKPSEEQ
ncbi:MAG: hypothetical protein HZA28_00450 [Candidatus Omnitrophica bacterium]|nr:hypothetical protein [Candidatus Omnitrophota bacterium]